VADTIGADIELKASIELVTLTTDAEALDNQVSGKV
jgi:hypothetical protein